MKSLIILGAIYPSFGAEVVVEFIGAVFGLSVALIIYRFSIIQVRIDRLKYVAVLIETIVPSVKRQAEYCQKYADLLDESPFTDEKLKIEANRDPKRLADKVDQEGVYHAFLWKYKRTPETYKAFQNFYGYVDYLDFLVDDLINTNEKILAAIWERKKHYQVLFKKLTENMQSLSLIPELLDTQPKFLNYTHLLLSDFSANNPDAENVIQSYEIVVRPLQKYIVEKGKQHTRITELLFLTQDLSNEYDGIRLAAKHNAQDFRYYATSFESTADKFIESSNTLRKDFSTAVATPFT